MARAFTSRQFPSLIDFDTALERSGLFPLRATGIGVLQVNFGKRCNQSCRHCHVDAGPGRVEMIDRATLLECLRVLAETDIPTVDLTGGAPELNPHLRWFVVECRRLGRGVMIRTNLTILSHPGMGDLAKFYRGHQLKVVGSLPYYLSRVVDAQRGQGVFDRSIRGIRALNDLGYGVEGSGLVLDLVYNPNGAFLPPAQCAIEADFRWELDRRCGVVFNRLFTMTNMPIGRFREFLDHNNLYEGYMQKLIGAYNPQAAAAAMCRSTLSVGWDGSIFDCDFNQMLGLRCNHGAPDHIKDFNLAVLKGRRIVTGIHCYGCTAGAGSSCGGALVDEKESHTE